MGRVGLNKSQAIVAIAIEMAESTKTAFQLFSSARRPLSRVNSAATAEHVAAAEDRGDVPSSNVLVAGPNRAQAEIDEHRNGRHRRDKPPDIR
jgi:hypothetical protein